MKIGIGIITTPKRIEGNVYNLDNYKQFLSYKYEYDIYTHIDSDSKGVSYGRNTCIEHLLNSGCDYVFLFDDDCYPMMFNWDEYIVENAIKNNLHYALLPHVFNAECLEIRGEISSWSGHLGCFTFFSKEMLNEVGFYNGEYNRYGFEDAAMHIRLKYSKLNNSEKLYTLTRIGYYIFSQDMYHRNPVVNLTMEEKMVYIQQNKSIYMKEIEDAKNGIIYHPFIK